MKTLEEWSIKDWKAGEISNNRTSNIKVHYEPNDKDKNGFKFKIVEFSEECDGVIKWALVMHGIAYFDGIRHLSVGEDEDKPDGYLHYSDPKAMAMLFKILESLEIMYCDKDQL